MDNIANKWVMIQAYKHNGELHRQWSHGFVLDENEDYFVVASIRASVIESDGRKWHTREPAIFILSKKKWFNVIAMIKEDGISYYVNIASPAIYDKEFIKYIDYDLDIKMFCDGSTKLLDVSEYHKHANELNYGPKITKILKSSVEQLYESIQKKEYPFQDDAIMKYFVSFKKRVA